MQNRLYLNDGNGLFTDATNPRMPTDIERTTDVVLGDVDGDGDLDLIVANLYGGPVDSDRLYLNLQRQLDAPAPLRIGQTWTLDAYLRYGPSSQGDLALPVVSLLPASVPLGPFGTLGIDPALMVPLPPIVIPQPAGVGSLSLPIVNDPRLVGTDIYAQALLVPFPVQPRLSNVVRDTLIQ